MTAMTLEKLYQAVDLVRARGYRLDAREMTELRLYPTLLASARLPASTPLEAFQRAACLAFAGIPKTLYLEPDHLEAAARAYQAVLAREPADAALIEPIAACLNSLVGASRVLHLGHPAGFPIWDARIESLRLGREPSVYHMDQLRSYLSYLDDLREIVAHPLFLTFHHDYCTAYQARLQRLRIPPYPLTEPRVVESAASELAALP